MHTAVKIHPAYSGPVVYVLDASRSVPVCQTLLDAKNRDLFVEDIKEQYQEMREEFYAGLEDRKYLPLPECQRKGLMVIASSTCLACVSFLLLWHFPVQEEEVSPCTVSHCPSSSFCR